MDVDCNEFAVLEGASTYSTTATSPIEMFVFIVIIVVSSTYFLPSLLTVFLRSIFVDSSAPRLKAHRTLPTSSLLIATSPLKTEAVPPAMFSVDSGCYCAH